MNVSELFYSIQGEGKLVGVPSVFIRLSGCNLRCTWCDTPYASWEPQGTEMSIDAIVEQSRAFNSCHAVLTGGEPLIFPEIVKLSDSLRNAGHHITVETAATVYQPIQVDLASISPKLSNSTPFEREGGRFAINHERQRLNIPVIQKLMDEAPVFQLKFVVSAPDDLDEIRTILDQLRRWSPADVLLMPEGTDQATLNDRASWIAEVCKQTGYRYCPRLHVTLYGNRRGT